MHCTDCGRLQKVIETESDDAVCGGCGLVLVGGTYDYSSITFGKRLTSDDPVVITSTPNQLNTRGEVSIPHELRKEFREVHKGVNKKELAIRAHMKHYLECTGLEARMGRSEPFLADWRGLYDKIYTVGFKTEETIAVCFYIMLEAYGVQHYDETRLLMSLGLSQAQLQSKMTTAMSHLASKPRLEEYSRELRRRRTVSQIGYSFASDCDFFGITPKVQDRIQRAYDKVSHTMSQSDATKQAAFMHVLGSVPVDEVEKFYRVSTQTIRNCVESAVQDGKLTDPRKRMRTH